MLKRLELHNFKCFDKLSVEMETLNVFAGINSMGKSSVIQALLLLRQTFEMGAIDKGLYLNGSLTQIGTGYHLMNRSSNTDMVKICLETDEKSMVWDYTYAPNSDFLWKRNRDANTELLSGVNLFHTNFCYISAERIGPQKFYNKSYHEIYEKNQLGVKGELVAGYLAERGRIDKVVNPYVIKKDVGSELLLYQAEAWLGEISPGVHLCSWKNDQAGIVGMEYTVNSEPYTPINVGFGLSYAAPIIVSILKAQPGDLVILENPEAHIHPMGQRKMGELIALASAGGVQIIVETHSDHLMNGIRVAVKNGDISNHAVRLNYFYQKDNLHAKCSPAILPDGRLSDWPDGFFDEWDKALDELL